MADPANGFLERVYKLVADERERAGKHVHDLRHDVTALLSNLQGDVSEIKERVASLEKEVELRAQTGQQGADTEHKKSELRLLVITAIASVIIGAAGIAIQLIK